MEDENILTEAHMVGGAQAVRRELGRATQEEIDDYVVFYSANESTELLDELRARTDQYAWAEAFVAAVGQHRWETVNYWEAVLKDNDAEDAIRANVPCIWRTGLIRHDLEILKRVEPYGVSVMDWKEAAFASVRGTNHQLLGWALEQLKQIGVLDQVVNIVLFDAIRQKKSEMIKSVLPFVEAEEIHSVVEKSVRDPHLFGPAAHATLEKAVLEHMVTDAIPTGVSRRKI